MKKKKFLFINGSASGNSSNEKLIAYLIQSLDGCETKVFNGLKNLPHFDPAFSTENTPVEITDIRTDIKTADGIIICTPEYIFSIPSSLKNLLEWCVATTVFSEKPVGIITASASGEKGHAELQLIIKTLGGVFHNENLLLVQGIKGKINMERNIDEELKEKLQGFIYSFIKSCKS